MKKYMKYSAIIVATILIIVMILIIKNNNNKGENSNFKIVTSFYPIYIMASNITEGAENIELVSMADVNTGCVHNYTLTTSDMKKIENADVFIQNGLNLESFMDKAITSNQNMKIIDSSENMQNLIKENDETNPHIWTSISNYIAQVKNITKGLKEVNPENAEIYEENSKQYIKELTQLKLKYETELQKLNGKNAISLNESFEYLARELGLNLTTIHTSHEDSTMSAENLKNIINIVKQNDIKIIIVDINDDLKNAQTIANETGATIYKLNSGVTGTLNKNAYINSMNNNLEILKDE